MVMTTAIFAPDISSMQSWKSLTTGRRAVSSAAEATQREACDLPSLTIVTSALAVSPPMASNSPLIERILFIVRVYLRQVAALRFESGEL